MAGIIGALTTTFTPAPSCIASFSDLFILQGGAYTVQGPVSANSCLPPNYVDTHGAYYSPGLCPAGYISAAQSLNVIGSLTETAVTCCPPSMGANPSPRSTYPWESTMGCTSGYPSETVTLVATWITNGLPGQTTTTIFGAGGQGVNAFSVEVRFQSTDFQSSATFSVSSPTPSSQISITSSSTSTTPMVTSSPARGISKGAAASIGLGSALGALLLVAVSAFAYRWWTTRRSDRQRPMADSTGDSKLPARAGELPASSQNVHELYAQHHSELHA